MRSSLAGCSELLEEGLRAHEIEEELAVAVGQARAAEQPLDVSAPDQLVHGTGIQQPLAHRRITSVQQFEHRCIEPDLAAAVENCRGYGTLHRISQNGFGPGVAD